MEKFKIKLNIKSFIVYERLTGKSFNSINYTSLEDMTKLIYCCFVANNDYKITYDSFMTFLNNKKISKSISEAFQEEVEYMQQFQNEQKEDNPKDENQSDYFIKDVVPILAMNCNLDINYILYELELSEMQSFLEVYNAQNQVKLEMDRMWCYFTMLPHIDSKKLKSPQDLIKFNWEEANTKNVLDDWDADKLDEILQTQIKEIWQIE